MATEIVRQETEYQVPERVTLTLHEELLQVADALEEFPRSYQIARFTEYARALKEASETAGRAFSGSWHGYQANVYYAGLQRPPPGAHFSAEWGLKDMSLSRLGTRGDWQEYDPEDLKAHIRALAGDPDLSEAREFVAEVRAMITKSRSEILSILVTALERGLDKYLDNIRERVEKFTLLEKRDILEILRPKGQFMTRDTVVVGQGTRAPPHIVVSCEAILIENAVGSCDELAKLAREAGSHMARRSRKEKANGLIGTNVFIGHGRSPLWRELKDFVENRIRLPTDEFNRVPVAGVTNIARLSEMLDASCIAFLVMTGEDEQKDGQLHARVNVVHEAGLFQGRLGFNRAIVILEDECEAFSNIEGLGQLRFPKGNIKAIFEDVRQVLEREDLVVA